MDGESLGRLVSGQWSVGRWSVDLIKPIYKTSRGLLQPDSNKTATYSLNKFKIVSKNLKLQKVLNILKLT